MAPKGNRGPSVRGYSDQDIYLEMELCVEEILMCFFSAAPGSPTAAFSPPVNWFIFYVCDFSPPACSSKRRHPLETFSVSSMPSFLVS